MTPAELLAELRAGGRPPPEAVAGFARGIAEGTVGEAQMAAFAMAVCMGPGLGEAGRVALTEAMRDGGEVLRWQLDGPVLDKHSTGGVGDPVSLVLAPALAACGAYVPMISGRGLGHTGGTLDKLESIPGLSTEGDVPRLRRITGEVGCAILGASGAIAPADARLYAVRDVTGTVESLDLITASILSKKLAAGLDALVLDVKCGSGAFSRDYDAARELAEALVATARGAGCPTVALITDMSEPLARSLGNALEVMEVMTALTGEDDGTELVEVAAELGGQVMALGGLVPDADEGASRIEAAISDGRAAEVFGRMVAAQGGAPDFVSRWRDRLPAARTTRDVGAPHAGSVLSIDGTALGRAVVALGGGRRAPGDRIDPSVGLSEVVRVGEQVAPGDPLAIVHASDGERAEAAVRAVRAAIEVGPGAGAGVPLIRGRIG